MEPKAQILFTSEEVVTTRPKNGTDFSLEEMQEIVGGSIEIIYLPKNNQIMVINEEGKNQGRLKNELATRLFKENYPIEIFPVNNDELVVGTVLICNKDMIK